MRLSRRERQVLSLLASGKRRREIARELGISVHTVRTYTRTAIEKGGHHSTFEAVAALVRGNDQENTD